MPPLRRQPRAPPCLQVSVCVPFTVQVAPSKDAGNGSYALSLDANSNASNAITATVLGDTLYLETAGFISTEPIQATILMPADKLQRLNHFSLSSVFVAPGKACLRAAVCCVGSAVRGSSAGACS